MKLYTSSYVGMHQTQILPQPPTIVSSAVSESTPTLLLVCHINIGSNKWSVPEVLVFTTRRQPRPITKRVCVSRPVVGSNIFAQTWLNNRWSSISDVLICLKLWRKNGRVYYRKNFSLNPRLFGFYFRYNVSVRTMCDPTLANMRSYSWLCVIIVTFVLWWHV